MTRSPIYAPYSDLAEVAVASAREVGDWLLERFGGIVPALLKGEDSVVTALDLEAERMIAARLAARYSHHTLIGEEASPDAPIAALSWAIDPIDGTRNFAVGVPVWAVSVAALEHGVPVAAGIYLPMTGEMYRAELGGGAWLGGERLGVSTVARLADAVVMTDPVPRHDRTGLSERYHGAMIGAARRTRMFGSVCCSLAWVASGRFELYYRPTVNLWDVAAGVLLVREAGGSVRTLTGEEWHGGADGIVAASSHLIDQFFTETHRVEETR